MTTPQSRLLRLADEAVADYNATHAAGGEAVYPAWVNDVRLLCAAPGVSTVEDERQAFEAWAKRKKMPLARIGEQYDDFWVDHAWNGSQARAALDTPAAGDALAWQGLTDAERDGYVGELVDYGTDFVVPLYSIVESIEQRLREKNAAQQAEQGAGR